MPECPTQLTRLSIPIVALVFRLQNSLCPFRKLVTLLRITSNYPFNPMNLLRRLFCFSRKPHTPPKRSLTTSSLMSGSATSAALYAITVSASSVTDGTPEEAKGKPHHLKDGKGFYNPWDSHRAMTAPKIAKAMIE